MLLLILEERFFTSLTEHTVNDYTVVEPNDARILAPLKTASVFRSRTEGIFCRIIKNPVDKPIKMSTRWMGTQIGGKECFIATYCDSKGNCVGDDRPFIMNSRDYEGYERTAVLVR